MRDCRCRDAKMHDFYTSDRAFHWCWPKFDTMQPSDPRPRITWNRYPHNVIGLAIIVRGRGFGVRWKS